jgi:hypothetical protein
MSASPRHHRAPWAHQVFNAVQAFDGLAAQRSTPFLLLEVLFNGLAEHPSAPE